MSKTRNNHYVPQWYQEGFFEPGRSSIAYVDMTPDQKVLPDGRIITHNGAWNDTPTSKAFFQADLYSIFFDTSVNDEIERRLFGDIDGRGSQAVRAFANTDVGQWHQHFQTFFEYLDIQKLRTPKGLDWLKVQYPKLSQNELMYEMQGLRMMHCTIWVEAVREIVSAENSDVKFIFSDHPVTIYNYAAPPSHEMAAYPLDPSIALKASQTIFPLNRDFCLILSNLEYASHPNINPLEKRTFARNYRHSLTRTDAFIRTRKLTREEITRINFVMKSRARRYIGGGRKEWLYPERTTLQPWCNLRTTFLPPNEELFHFGGEIITQYESGHVEYQDEFGRSEKPRDFLLKTVGKNKILPRDACGCGSGRLFRSCCQPKPDALRPSWKEHSIRERNIFLQNGIVKILGLNEGKDWVQIRREITDEKIKEIYFLYEALWPLETDLLALLPKPDGVARAVYTGSIHPSSITDFALAAPLYFGELIVPHPFIHSGVMAKNYRPTENPKHYRQDFLKSIIVFMTIMPLVECSFVHLIPDPVDFDFHLRDQMLRMAEARALTIIRGPDKEPRLVELMQEDHKRSLILMPQDALRKRLRYLNPEMKEEEIEATLRFAERKRELDPLAVLQDGSLDGKDGGQMNMFKLAPNFEMTMYLAQATGACIVTDSPTRWHEIKTAIRRKPPMATKGLATLSERINGTAFAFLQNTNDIIGDLSRNSCVEYTDLFRDLFGYLSRLEEREPKPNREAQFVSRFQKLHASAQANLTKSDAATKKARISCMFPHGGIQHNTINRLLLMSSSERHLSSVPMAFYFENYESDKSGALK